MQYVMQTDINDKEIGLVEKLKAHKEQILHRAFSVFVVNRKGEMLVQKRAEGKYHSGGKWTNACCSHPLTADIKAEAKQRMTEELGFTCDIEFADKFLYFAAVGDNVWEYEIDNVFFGVCENDVQPTPDEEEVSEIKWIASDQLKKDMAENPDTYTRWFITAFYNLVKIGKI